MKSSFVTAESVRFSYASTLALDGVSFEVGQGEFFSLVGPNGGGKSTLFKIFATLLQPDTGSVTFDGKCIVREAHAIRKEIGVTFQHPSLDLKLTVHENLKHHGHFYGLKGAVLADRIDSLLSILGLISRSNERCESLSGGLKRRVEVAKSLIHQPKILLLDEPTTGLDPVARKNLWEYVRLLQKEQGLTVLCTTHLMEEAEASDRMALIHKGKLIAKGTPSALRSEIGSQVVSIKTQSPLEMERHLQETLNLSGGRLVDNEIRFEGSMTENELLKLFSVAGEKADSVTVGRPTLEDFFVARTGLAWEGA